MKNIAKVWLNGQDLGTIWTSPWQVDVSGVLKQGKNELKIEVTNLWGNRLIGDEQKVNDGIVNGQWPEWLLKGEKRPSDRYTFTTYPHYTKDTPLLESGLLGPVQSICRKYQLSKGTILRWEKEYVLAEKALPLSSELLRKLEQMRTFKETAKVSRSREEELEDEIMRLRKALEYSELRNEALHEVLKIGREQFGIDLLKKVGAKQ